MPPTISLAKANAIFGASGGIPSGLERRDVSSWAKRTRRTDTPLLMMIDKADPFDDPMAKVEWGLSSPFPFTDVLAASVASAVVTTITVTNDSYFADGDVFRIDDEFMQVVSHAGANVLNVTRGVDTSVATTHNNAAVIMIVAPAMTENQDTPLSPHKQGELDYNYAQQIEFSNQISHRGKIIKTYESLAFGGNRFKKMANDLLGERAPLSMEQILLYQLREAGTTSIPPKMGGCMQPSYTATRNTSFAGAPLTEQILMDNLQTVYNLVGSEKMGKTILAHPIVIRIISSWYKSIRRIAQDAKKLSLHISEIDTMFGTFKLVPHYNWQKPVNTAFTPFPGLLVANFKDFKLRALHSSTAWQLDYVADPYTNGWYEKCYVRGDYTMVAEEPYSRLYLENFSVAQSDYPGMP